MSIQPKYKAWDSEQNIMYECGNPFAAHYTTNDDGVHFGELRMFGDLEIKYKPHRFIFLKYLGITALSGHELYEGALIKHTSTPLLCKIIYKQKIAQFMAKEITENGKVWQLSTKKVLYVLGNIYQDSNLLTQ